MIDWNAAKFFLDFIALGFAFAAWIYAWRVKHDRAWQTKLAELSEVISGHEIKIVTLSERMAAMPKHGDLEQIHDRISGVKDSVSDMRSDTSMLLEAVNGLKRSFDILNNHHMGLKT